MTVLCKRIGDHALPVPAYATEGAAAVDLRAHIPGDPLVLRPGDENLISTGFAMQIPDHLALYLLPRSGLGVSGGIVLGNLVGLIDPDYRGAVQVALWYRRDEGPEVTICNGDRICQAALLPRVVAEFVEVGELTATERGAGGFGSSGRA